ARSAGLNVKIITARADEIDAGNKKNEREPCHHSRAGLPMPVSVALGFCRREVMRTNLGAGKTNGKRKRERKFGLDIGRVPAGASSDFRYSGPNETFNCRHDARRALPAHDLIFWIRARGGNPSHLP